MPDASLHIIGYHGTLSDRALHITQNGFHASEKEIEWLGHGVYFFTEYHHAEAWARQEYHRQCQYHDRVSPPVVLSVNILFERENLLDLDRKDTMNSFQRELKKGYQLMFCSDDLCGAPQFNDEREERCFWCNYYARTHPDIKLIAFSFPRIRYRGFGFPVVHRQRQLCVMDNSCIQMPPRQMEVATC